MADEDMVVDPDVLRPFPLSSPALPDNYPDPFNTELSGRNETPTQPFRVVQGTLLKAALGEDVNLEAAAELFTFDTTEISKESNRITPVDGSKIPPIFRDELSKDGGWLYPPQWEYYKENPDLSYPPAFLVPDQITGTHVPILRDIHSVPSAVALPMQMHLRVGLPATTPDALLSDPIIRALSPYSNPVNLVHEIAPPISRTVSHALDPESTQEVLHKRACFAQKLAHRNLHAEKNDYKQMNFSNFTN